MRWDARARARIAHHIGREDRGETTGLAHVASPAAIRTPERYSSRWLGFCNRLTFGITLGVIACSRVSAEDIIRFDNNVTEVDPDSKSDPLLREHLQLTADHPALDLCSTAHRIYDTRKFRQQPSPVFFTIRPRCSLIFGSTSCRRQALSRSCVPSSSAPMRRAYSATSPARIAASRRST